ncbi:alpha/beta hydrolase [Quadrisphaera sp. DSM 44207]|uniref:alpha/beta hydrolase n=1 Tax=Quadrisphaera sp. DSM 44207 TaxID=1881057 RepID=UPI00088E6801|nr:PHB depolymerase family esterase [Quadrisphaera sp. DSM 44207]SDQ06086.1 phospholipase/carboxylesterase [Quadrisphaera sp. DSM 44207]
MADGHRSGHRSGRLSVRVPRPPAGADPSSPPPAAGTRELDLGGGARALQLVPRGLGAGPAPLAVVLHGAGGTAEGMLRTLAPVAERCGAVLLLPQSGDRTWDVIRGGYGPDVRALDAALAHTVRHCPVDPDRVAVTGFSDGASYALSLGVANGDVFTHVLAWSPGFAAPLVRSGSPRVFVCHGTADAVLPIDRTSRTVVPRLRAEGLDVTCVEFEGAHVMSGELVERSFTWFAGC